MKEVANSCHNSLADAMISVINRTGVSECMRQNGGKPKKEHS